MGEAQKIEKRVKLLKGGKKVKRGSRLCPLNKLNWGELKGERLEKGRGVRKRAAAVRRKLQN